MAKYRKRTIVVEAEQWFKHGDVACVERSVFSHRGGCRCSLCNSLMDVHGVVQTLEGKHIVCPGDWIITGIKGEKYSCKPDIFQETYELIGEKNE